MKNALVRCWETSNSLYVKYHDEEWGTPLHDDKKMYELLILEGFQAGLTWELILKRRESLTEAFEGFDPKKIAQYTDKDAQRLIESQGMIRNRAKISSAINNAKRFIEIQKEFGSFDAYVWQFVDGKIINHALKDFSQMPSETEESRRLSEDLRKRGFKFVGPTICYAFMQAVGMVNDHLTKCFRYRELNSIKK